MTGSSDLQQQLRVVPCVDGALAELHALQVLALREVDRGDVQGVHHGCGDGGGRASVLGTGVFLPRLS